MQTAEEIYRRLILNAARVWGYSPNEMDEEGFDPLVGLMLGGLSKELERAYQELADSKARIITDLASHLTPDVLTNVLPAHAIIHGMPIEVKDVAVKEAQFITDLELDDISERVTFAPANDFALVKASVKYIANNNTVYQQQLNKKETALKANGAKLPINEVWLGIDVDSKIRNLDGFNFFIDWSFDPNKLSYLDSLKMTKWVFGDMELNMKVGLDNYNLPSENSELSNLDRIRRDVISRYSNHFLKVEMEDINLFGNQDAFETPEMLAQAFGKDEIASLKGNLIWIRVIFPQFLSHRSLQYVNCNLNCFPVINCKYYTNNVGLKERKTFFPIECDGRFLGLTSILDKNDNPIQDQRATKDDEKGVVTYNLKEQGVQRFDNRQAKDLLDYLFGLLRDESFAFSKYKVNIQSEDLKNLRQQVNALVEDIKKDQNQDQNDSPFLILNTKEFPQIVKIEYCTTSGELANKVPAGNKLKVLKGILVDGTTLAFMTSTWGGRSFVDDEDKIRMFKHALISRDSLVTKMDVIAYCKAKLGHMLEDVFIEHGAEISKNKNEGIIRTLNINLVLKEDKTWDENELIYLKNDLKNEIESRSFFIYPIRIIDAE